MRCLKYETRRVEYHTLIQDIYLLCSIFLFQLVFAILVKTFLLRQLIFKIVCKFQFFYNNDEMIDLTSVLPWAQQNVIIINRRAVSELMVVGKTTN